MTNNRSAATGLSRRDVLRGIGGGAIAAGLGSFGLDTPAQAQPTTGSGEEAAGFRFLVMPDFHLRREHRSPEGMAAALDAAMRLDPKPAFIVTGGDLCHNLRNQTLDQCIEMADLFVTLWKEHVDVPGYHALGNHDAAGWGDGLDSFPGGKDHPLFGFNLLQQKLNMPGLSHSFDHGGWHFAAVHDAKLGDQPGSVIGEFEDDALAFLRDDLSRNRGKPTMLFGHYPPVTAIEFFNGEAEHNDEQARWELGYGRATRNPIALIEAIGDADVKAFFSGHIHRLDRITAKDQTFICAGSVSGNQWRGPDVDTQEGFGVIDCRPDGTFDYAYHDSGWEARA